MIYKRIRRDQFLLVIALALNAVAGSVFLHFMKELLTFLPWIIVSGLASGIYAIVHFRYNLFYQIRIALLITIGSFAGVVKSFNPIGFFSPVETSVQSFEIGIQMFVLTSLALLGACVGLLAGSNKADSQEKIDARSVMPKAFWFWMMLFASIATLVSGYLSARSYGPTVFGGVYGAGEGSGQLLGNLQSIGIVSLVLVFVASEKQVGGKFSILPILLAVYYLGWGILLRGGRLEFLSGVLALLIAIPVFRGDVFKLRPFHYFVFLLLALFMELWGNLRATLYAGAAESILDGYTRLAEMGIYHAGTISGIASTFSNILHMIDNHVIDYQWGVTYFEYILRSPPEFLYPNRPADISMMFFGYGYASVGGIFELAEAYYNFGAFGCLIIPFMISYGMARIYTNALKGGWLYFFLLAALLSVFFRGAWYQSFAYYKGLLTGLVFFFLCWLMISFLGAGKKNIRLKSVGDLNGISASPTAGAKP